MRTAPLEWYAQFRGQPFDVWFETSDHFEVELTKKVLQTRDFLRRGFGFRCYRGGVSSPSTGDVAPDFTARDTEGTELVLSALCERGPVILAFFPKAFTPG